MESEKYVRGWDVELPADDADARAASRPPRRSLLFMPGDSRRKIEKAAGLAVDTIVMDLEDGVALAGKEAARAGVAAAFDQVDFGTRERLIRINPVSSANCRTDLEATAHLQPDGYVIPKVENSDDLLSVDHYLRDLESQNGWPVESIRLLALIETPLGVLNVGDIAGATSRLDALAFGAEDLAGSMGATRTSAGWEVFYARSAVVTAAAAYALQAIDTVFVDLSDLEGLAQECAFARTLGYTGKLAIHPGQVEVINREFSPTADAVAAARRLIDAHDDAQAQGLGAFELDGRMVDMPMVRAAQSVLRRARAAGMLE